MAPCIKIRPNISVNEQKLMYEKNRSSTPQPLSHQSLQKLEKRKFKHTHAQFKLRARYPKLPKLSQNLNLLKIYPTRKKQSQSQKRKKQFQKWFLTRLKLERKKILHRKLFSRTPSNKIFMKKNKLKKK